MLLRATMALFWKFYKRLSFESERVSYSVVSNSVSLWTVVPQAPLFMGFSRQEYWSGLSCPPPGDLPDLRMEPAFSHVSCIDKQTVYHTWEALHVALNHQ